MNKKIIIFCIMFVFITSSLVPIVPGDKIEVEKQDKYLSDLDFLSCDNSYSSNMFLQRKYFEQEHIKNNEDRNLVNPTESSVIVTNNGPISAPWPMFSHDIRHTGRSPFSTLNNPLTEKWRYFCEGMIMETPIIDNNGTIYIQGYDCFDGKPYFFKAINPNGTVKWILKTGDITGSSPAIADDGTIYVGSWDDYLFAVNQDGTLKWKFNSANAGIFSSPVIASDGTIYFGTLWSLGAGGKIHAVNPNGIEIWRYQTGYAITSSPAIGNDGTIYIGSDDTYLYAMYPNGTLRWQFKTGDWVAGSPSVAEDGTIYFPSYDNYLYALNPDGTLKWKFNTGYGAAGAPVIGADDTIYVGTDKVYAIYPNGVLKWSFDYGSDRYIGWSSPAISADGTIYVGVSSDNYGSGEILAINSDGTERWRERLGDSDLIDSSPSIGADGTVYIGTSYDLEFYPGWWTGVCCLHAFGKVDSNTPPEKPTISGSPYCEFEETYILYVSANDTDNNPVSFYIGWGDGAYDNVGSFASGEPRLLRHNWLKSGNLIIKVKAKDEFGGESNIASLTVSVTKDRAINSFLLKFLDQFPLLQKLVLHLIN
jgi:outer membrane protein assembly factor BamB